MRSRAARLSLAVLAYLLAGAATVLVFSAEQQIAGRRSAVRTLDVQARAAVAAIADLRAAQQAYVAAGQGAEIWTPKVAALLREAAGLTDGLRASAASVAARRSLMEAGATLTELGNIDNRVHGYLASDDRLMAADVVFSEGGAVAAAAAHQVEAARLAEQQQLDASEAGLRREQAYAVAAAGLFALLGITLLSSARPQSPGAADATAESAASMGGLALRAPAGSPAAPELPLDRDSVPALKLAADLCTEFSCANDRADLVKLLGRAADAMDASGLVLWMATVPGGELRPVLAHGYPPQVLARMPPVPRAGDNAAAAAYRTGALQIVLTRPGVSNGAVVAPLRSPDGCIGALTAEIRGGSETSDSVQALAALFAAQLSSVLAFSTPAAADTHDGRIASAQ